MSKPPSSLHYSELLHELGLKNWRRALLARDWRRASLNANRLASSADRFWRWVGCCHLATTHLARGDIEPALEQLRRAVRTSEDVPRMHSVARQQLAHIHLELGDAKTACAELAPLYSLDDAPREVLYWGALASGRLGRADESLSCIERLEPQSDGWRRAWVAHVRAELMEREGRRDEALETLESAIELLDRPSTPKAAPLVPVRSTLAGLWRDSGEPNRARDILQKVAEDAEALIHWPIPYVRSFYLLGTLQLPHQAAEAERRLQSFLSFWEDGELDRERVRDAKARLKRDC